MTKEAVSEFAVTWDYLCPFARNAHEHVVAGLEAGADWHVTFLPFSLMQGHVPEGGTPVWEEPEPANGVLALQAGVVVSEEQPEAFLRVHRRLFAARHDQGRDLRDPDVVRAVLDAEGLDADRVFAAIGKGWPLDHVRRAHEVAVADHEVFGVPTFVVDDRAAFVRLMTRPGPDRKASIDLVDQLLNLVAAHSEINELKHTTIPR